MTRAAIYLRISQDRTGGGAGVARQEQDCRAKVRALGWDLVEVYSDNDLSAFSGKRRPGYEAMLEAIRARQVEAVVVWDQDRLDKGGLEAEQFINLADQYRVALASVGGDFDLSTDQGRLMYRIKGAVSRAELERKSARQKRANRQRAESGRFHGSRRPFGYEPGGLAIREAEAEAIRDGYRLVLNGGSFREVARVWNSRGLLTPQKNQPWNGSLVSQTLRNPRLAGWRTYKGTYDKTRPDGQKWVGGFYDPATNPLAIVRDEHDQPVPAEWPAIVDADTWHAAYGILVDPTRKSKFHSARPSRLLLSGVAVCGVCGSTVQSGGKLRGRDRYRCAVATGGHVMREAAPVDDFIEDLVLRRLAEPDLVEQFAKPDAWNGVDVAALRRQASEVNHRLDGLAESYAAGLISQTQMIKGTERARVELANIEAAMPATDPTSTAIRSLVTGLDLLRAWDELSLDAKRGVVDALLTIRLLSPKSMRVWPYVQENGVRKVNPHTLELTWK